MNAGITSIIVFIVLGIGLALAITFLWNALEIAYRSVMVVFYSAAYVVISIWDIGVWFLLLPVRIVRWFLGAQKSSGEGAINA